MEEIGVHHRQANDDVVLVLHLLTTAVVNQFTRVIVCSTPKLPTVYAKQSTARAEWLATHRALRSACEMLDGKLVQHGASSLGALEAEAVVGATFV